MKTLKITIGGTVTKQDLEAKGIVVSDYAKDMLEKVKFSETKQKIEFGIVTVKELGFESFATMNEIYARVKEQGYALCEAEDGPQLRLQYDQPIGEWLYVGMKPITARDGRPDVFIVNHGVDGLRLGLHWALLDDVWASVTRFVFRVKSDEIAKKVLNNTDKTGDCWIWKGALRKGYGRIAKGYKTLTTHRVIYEAFVGKVPQGEMLDHLCRNRACVNPKHLEIVTNKENVLRGIGRTAINAKKTHCDSGHLLAGENLRIYKGKRYCVACQKNRVAGIN